MPIQFIDGSEDPEFETRRHGLLKAAAQSLSPAGTILTDDAIREVLEREKPEFYRIWGPVPDLDEVRAKRLLNEVRERHRDRTRNSGMRRKAVSRPGR
jgi:hypothetical protein